jgi:hypothetical protein
MRASADEIMPHLNRSLSGGAQGFFHAGTNGRWRNVLTPEDLAAHDAKLPAKFSPALAAWIEGGRRAAGDPRLLDIQILCTPRGPREPRAKGSSEAGRGIQRGAEPQRGRRSSQFDRRRERAGGLILGNPGSQSHPTGPIPEPTAKVS